MVVDIFPKILLSLAIGALIGIEREKRVKGETAEGLRTFILVAIMGTLSAYLSFDFLSSPIPIFISLVVVGILVTLGYIEKIKHHHFGLTTEMAFLITYLLGLFIYFDNSPYYFSVSMGIILAFILFAKEASHRFAKHLTETEIFDAIIFGILAFIILPVLPDRTIDPFNSINPVVVWKAMVLVLSVGFAGYIAMKIFGVSKGSFLTGVFGGLVSSTSVAISMAQKFRENKKLLYPAAFSIIIASSIMFLRIGFVVNVINPELGVSTFLPMLVISLLGLFLSYFSWRKRDNQNVNVSLKSPFSLSSALKFGALFAATLFISSLASSFGGIGIYITAIVAGLVDTDAITISLASLAKGSISTPVAVNGIILAVLSNTISKWFLVSWIGNYKIGREVGKVFIILLIAGILSLFIISRIIL